MGTQSFFVPGPLPGLNDLIAWAKKQGVIVGKKGAKWNFYAAQKKSWEDHICLWISAAKIQPVSGPVVMRYVWAEPHRRRDPSNIAAGKKFIEDALVRAGILKGDGWRDVEEFTDTFTVNKKQPGVRVTIIPSDGLSKED